MNRAVQWWRQWGRRGDVLAGAAAGLLIGALAAAIVWPDEDPATRQAVPEITVPPAPTLSPPSTDDVAEESTPSPVVESDQGGEPSDAPPLTDVPPAGEGPLPDTARVTCPTPTVTVSSADELSSALEDARPGDSIELSAGTYSGSFVATTSGAAGEPIFLCGPEAAVIDGGDVSGDYSFHLDGAKYWRLVGFTVQGGQKGVMADGTVGSVFQGLTVTGTGDEAIHLRTHSTDNVVRDNTISDTGQRRDKFGEGVYIGSAVSNWCTYTGCDADRSDRNVVHGNTFVGTSSEAIDVKEGTTGGVVSSNTFDGSALTGADSWVDIKGNNYLIHANQGTDAPEDGYQTHQILDGWGDHNVFANNRADVGGPGHAISSWPPVSNVVRCDNTFTGAGEGLSNIPCS